MECSFQCQYVKLGLIDKYFSDDSILGHLDLKTGPISVMVILIS